MQCVCGRFFKPTSYRVGGKHYKEFDLCGACLASSNSGGYLHTKEWVGQNITGLMFGEYGNQDNTSNLEE